LIASEFVHLKVDVIVTGGNATLAVKRTSLVIPIICAQGRPAKGGSKSQPPKDETPKLTDLSVTKTVALRLEAKVREEAV
jgi:hypothetical protein